MSLLRHAWMFTLALAACAGTTAPWQKPGTNEATAKEDTEQCRLAARFAPIPRSLQRPPSSTAATGALTREEELAVHETEAFQACMRDKGYSARR